MPKKYSAKNGIIQPARDPELTPADLKKIKVAERKKLDKGTELLEQMWKVLVCTKVKSNPYIHHKSGREVEATYLSPPSFKDIMEMSDEEKEAYVQLLQQYAEFFCKVAPHVSQSSKILLAHEKPTKENKKEEEPTLTLNQILGFSEPAKKSKAKGEN